MFISQQTTKVDPSTVKPIVIDHGSSNVKFGCLGDEGKCFRNIVGRQKHCGIPFISEDNTRDSYTGDKAIERMDYLKMKSPMKQGLINNYNDFEKVLHNIFYNELKVEPTDLPVFITETPKRLKDQKEKMSSILFETFCIDSLCLCACPAILTMYALGKTTCTVLDCGDGISHTCCIVDGKPVRKTIKKNEIGGRDVTKHFHQLMEERGYEMNASCCKEYYKRMKEEVCYITKDYYSEIQKYNDTYDKKKVERVYTLPDGSDMVATSQSFRAPEILFHPEYFDIYGFGVHQLVQESIKHIDEKYHEELFGNIIVSGGSSKFEGFDERLVKELSRSGKKVKSEILNHPKDSNFDRVFLAYNGAMTFLEVDGKDPKKWCSKEEYDEYGGTIIHKKVCWDFESSEPMFEAELVTQ